MALLLGSTTIASDPAVAFLSFKSPSALPSVCICHVCSAALPDACLIWIPVACPVPVVSINNFVFVAKLYAFNIKISESETDKNFKYYHVYNDAYDVVSISIAFKSSGYIYDETRNSGISAIFIKLMNDYSFARNKDLFRMNLAKYGIRLRFNVDADNFYITAINLLIKIK